MPCLGSIIIVIKQFSKFIQVLPFQNFTHNNDFTTLLMKMFICSNCPVCAADTKNE